LLVSGTFGCGSACVHCGWVCSGLPLVCSLFAPMGVTHLALASSICAGFLLRFCHSAGVRRFRSLL
jgi:hypothetical protein